MKDTNKHDHQPLGLYFLIAVAAILVNCASPKRVKFKELVDTKDKQITYQAKKTYHLDELGVWVDNNFDGAHLNGATQLNDSTIMLKFDPENLPINKSPYYAFKTWSDMSKQIYFSFNYPDGFEHRYTPKKKLNEHWSIVDSMDVISSEDDTLLRLQVEKEATIIAAQEINSSSDVRNWYLQNIVASNNFVFEKSAGKTMLGKNIPVLDIYHGNPDGKPIIVLLTRQHPPEVTGYFAYQHFLETIVDGSQLSTDFLNNYRVLTFPIMNPDGVDLGHWRHNANGVDLNRDWSKYRQLEIKNVVSYITTASKTNNGKIILGLDFHSTYEDVFYTNKTRTGTTLPNFINDWFALLEKNIEGYKVNEKDSNSNKPVSKGWFLYGQNATGVTYEIGDHTPKERIAEIGAISANAMMEVLLKE